MTPDDDASSGRTDGRVKYPRTYHLPWSPGRTSDDRVLPSLDGFIGEDVVVTAKMDGENTTLRRECLHARSLDWEPHPSRTMIKALHARVAADIPAGWRLCGENLQAVHSIRYTQLPDVFLLFSVWDERNRCLSWAETLDWALLLDLATVPVLYRGPWDEDLVRGLHQPTRDGDPCEGYVVRTSEGFPYADFKRRVGKYVRAAHVQTDQHWMRRAVELNGIVRKR
jgi:hypothetical protein